MHLNVAVLIQPDVRWRCPCAAKNLQKTATDHSIRAALLSAFASTPRRYACSAAIDPARNTETSTAEQASSGAQGAIARCRTALVRACAPDQHAAIQTLDAKSQVIQVMPMRAYVGVAIQVTRDRARAFTAATATASRSALQPPSHQPSFDCLCKVSNPVAVSKSCPASCANGGPR